VSLAAIYIGCSAQLHRFTRKTKFAAAASARVTLALQHPAIRRMHVHGYTRAREDVQREAIV